MGIVKAVMSSAMPKVPLYSVDKPTSWDGQSGFHDEKEGFGDVSRRRQMESFHRPCQYHHAYGWRACREVIDMNIKKDLLSPFSEDTGLNQHPDPDPEVLAELENTKFPARLSEGLASDDSDSKVLTPELPYKVELRLKFIDFAGVPIQGLKTMIVLDEKTIHAKTNAKGEVPTISDLLPSGLLAVWIKKDDGNFSLKYEGQVSAQSMTMCLVSPYVRIPIMTEEHHGLVAKAEKKPAIDPTAKDRPIIAPVNPGTRPTPQQLEVLAKRNTSGLPVSVASAAHTDATGRTQMPTACLWSQGDFRIGCKQTTPSNEQAREVAKNTSGVVSAETKSADSKVGKRAGVSSPDTQNPKPTHLPPLDEASRKKLADLMKLMAEQSKWNFDEIKGMGSHGILAAINGNNFTYPSEKPEGMSKKVCYMSVKIGLMRSAFVSSIDGDERPYLAGAWLGRQGFSNVTEELPDARWAAPGDVILYKYPKAKSEENARKAEAKYKKEVEKYDVEKQHLEEARKAWEKRKEEWQTVNPKKKFQEADPMGKLRVAPKLKDVNYGHIDVRTYDGYVSDFKTKRLPDSSGFEVGGIYRKISDPIPDIRLRAFLKVLREWECHELSNDAERYFKLGLNLKVNGSTFFSNVADHPFKGTIYESRQFNPAGAYQIILSTYNGLTDPDKGKGLTKGFSPRHQDRLAVALIEDQPGSILGLIREGKIEEACVLLKGTWSSLPGNPHDSRKERRGNSIYLYTMQDVLAAHEKFMKELA